jgi:hypothetical protein
MAINVFLVFFFRTSPDSFRRWWWVYCIVCYGGPFIIALSLLFVRQEGRGPVYGGATVSLLQLRFLLKHFLELHAYGIWVLDMVLGR